MTRRFIGLRTGTLCASALLATSPLHAQLRSPTAAPWQTGAAVAWETYTFTEPEAVGIGALRLLSVPFAGSVRLFGDAQLSLTGAFASGTLERDSGESTTISGLTDSYLALDIPVARDFVSVSLVAALPTGTSSFTREDAEAAGAFAADLLPFRVSSWGSGGALGAATTLVRSAGPMNFGVSAGYSIAREFEPLRADELTYRPGSELTLRLAVDRALGRSGKVSLQVGAQRYGGDELNGQNLYQSGDRYTAVLSGAAATGPRASAAAYLGVLHRTEGSFLDPTGGVVPGEEVPTQSLLLAGGGLRVPVGAGTLLPQADGRLFRREDGEGQGYVGGVGVGYETALGSARITPLVRARMGRLVVSDGVESGLTGLETALSIRFGGVR